VIVVRDEKKQLSRYSNMEMQAINNAFLLKSEKDKSENTCTEK